MRNSRLTAAYLVLFRFVPLFIILCSAVLWQLAGHKVAIVTCAALFALDAAVLVALVVRQGKRGPDDGDEPGAG